MSSPAPMKTLSCLLLVGLVSQLSLSADEASHAAAVQKLITVMDMEKNHAATLENLLQAQTRQNPAMVARVDNLSLLVEAAQNAVQAESADPVRPRPLFSENQPQNARPGTNGITLPDSSTLAQNLEGAKVTMSSWKTRLWQSAQPIWEFVMWTFNSMIVLLICFAGLCRYVAKTAAAESKISPKGRVITGRWIIGAHQNASGMLLIITWIIAIFFLIDIFMWLIYLDLPIWLLVVIWFPTLWLAEKITGWIVPNLRGDDANYA